MVVVDGKSLRDKILEELRSIVVKKKLKPDLAIILVGENPSSLAYIKQKINSTEKIGGRAELFQYPTSVTETEILKKIEQLNKDAKVKGIIVQLPLPKHMDPYKVTQAVSVEKDVDGLNEDSSFQPATPLAVLEILKEFKVSLKDHTAVIFGRSRLVGAPLKAILEEEGAKVIQIHSQTPTPVNNLSLKGEILISAVGKAHLIKETMVKEGAAVIDVGISRDPETDKLTGDVDFENVKEKASLITPVPGGVGPLTVAMLLKNLVQASEL